MPKRARSSLTGGTGDVNPQWFNLSNGINPEAAYADSGNSIPIQRLPDGNSAQVMEVLKVEWGFGSASTFTATSADANFRGYLLTRSFGTAEPTSQQSSGVLISKWQPGFASRSIGTPADQQISIYVEAPYVEDLTDGMGHGVLVATDQLFLGTVQSGATNPVTGNITCRLLYRWKNVRLSEYIGIVQSQQ
jgi:hypothetical protein